MSITAPREQGWGRGRRQRGRRGLVGARPDLAEADLSGGVVTGCDLSAADLRGAVLSGADLRGSRLDAVDPVGPRWDGARVDLAQAVVLAEALGVAVDVGPDA